MTKTMRRYGVGSDGERYSVLIHTEQIRVAVAGGVEYIDGLRTATLEDGTHLNPHYGPDGKIVAGAFRPIDFDLVITLENYP